MFWALFESCLWLLIKKHAVVDKTAETQVCKRLRLMLDCGIMTLFV